MQNYTKKIFIIILCSAVVCHLQASQVTTSRLVPHIAKGLNLGIANWMFVSAGTALLKRVLCDEKNEIGSPEAQQFLQNLLSEHNVPHRHTIKLLKDEGTSVDNAGAHLGRYILLHPFDETRLSALLKIKALNRSEQNQLDTYKVKIRHEIGHILHHDFHKKIFLTMPTVALATHMLGRGTARIGRKIFPRMTPQRSVSILAVAAAAGLLKSGVNKLLVCRLGLQSEIAADREAITHASDDELLAFAQYFVPRVIQEEFEGGEYAIGHPRAIDRLNMAIKEVERRQHKK